MSTCKPPQFDALEACAKLSRRRLAPAGGGKPGESPTGGGKPGEYDEPGEYYEPGKEDDSCGTTLDSKGDTLECYYCALKDRCLPCYGCTGNPRTCREGACTQAMAGPGFERPGPRDDWWVADPPPLPPPPVPPPLMPPAPPPATVPIGLLVGVLAGVVVFILVDIAIVVFCCRRATSSAARSPTSPRR